jgi:arylsulfatase A-like enzyme
MPQAMPSLHNDPPQPHRTVGPRTPQRVPTSLPVGLRRLAPLPLALLLSGCTCTALDAPIGPRPAGWSDPSVDTTGATPVASLWRMTGTYVLPESSVPPELDLDADTPLSFTEDTGKTGAMRVWKAKVPFDLGDEARRSAPTGMSVRVDGEEVPFSSSAVARATGKTWRIKGKFLVVTWPGQPKTMGVGWQGVSASVARRDFGKAGLDPQDFVQHSVTLSDRSREGLLLPAPATASWELTLPTNAPVFDAWLALEPSPLAFQASDGAAVSVTVIEGGQRHEVGRKSLSLDANFEHWRVSLKRWAGKTVTVEIGSHEEGTGAFDYVFLGAPAVWGGPSAPVRRVLVIGMDTTRPDHMGYFGYDRDTTPELDAILSQSAVFTTAFTPAPRTRPSFRSATTGRYPLDAVGAPNIAEVFQAHGFATAGFVANVHLQPRFGFSTGFDHWWFDGRAKADEQVDRLLDFYDSYGDRDTYVFLHLMDPHIFYDAPGSFRHKWLTEPDPELGKSFNRWQVRTMDQRGELTDKRKAHIKALYDGEMSYMSYHLGRLFDRLDRLPGNTLTVLHNDHGEEFWEHESFEHNHTLYREVTTALLAVRPGHGIAPPAPMQLDTPTTLVDIAPTLYDFAGFDDAPPSDGRSLRPLLEGGPSDGWERPLGIAHLRYGHERWAVVHKQHKYILHTASGVEEMYDLRTDIEEQFDLAEAFGDLDGWRRALAEAHGMEVGEGWRIDATLYAKDRVPTTFVLPQPARAAGLIDPESTVDNPRNQAWGEAPRRAMTEVGTAQLSDDGLELHWEPGTNPRDALLYVIFDEPVEPAGTLLRQGETEIVLKKNALGQVRWSHAATKVLIRPGTVVVPPEGEASRMRAAASASAGSDLQMLEALGYIHDEDGDH